MSIIQGNDGNDIACNGEAHDVLVNATGGILPYTYRLASNNLEQTNNNFTLHAGEFTIVVIDANETETTCSVTINQPDEIYANLGAINDECQIDEGQIDIIMIEGGFPPYTLTWKSPTRGTLDQDTLIVESGWNVGSFTGARGGETYVFDIVDSNGCDLSGVSYIAIEGSTTGEPLEMSSEVTPILSNQDLGAIDITVTGGSPPYTYYWSTFITDEDLQNLDVGTYSVEVTDSYNCSLTANFELESPNAFNYSINEIDSDCIAGGGDLVINCTDGIGPYMITYTGGNFDQQELTIDGDSGTALFTGIEAGQNYQITIIAANGYTETFDFESHVTDAPQLVAPHLCLVTNNPVTGQNRLVWESPSDQSEITKYNIYRESNFAGEYELIGSTLESKENVFVDQDSSPSVQSYIYHIKSATDCNIESASSNEHKTIHLVINQGINNRINLEWDEYEGVPYSQINIFRGPSPTDLTLWKSISASIFSFTDTNPPTGDIYYQIELVAEIECDNQRGLFSIKSNIGAFEQATSTEDVSFEIDIYPNPVKDRLIINTDSALDCTLFDSIGKEVMTSHLHSGSNILDIDLENGFYFIRLQKGNEATVKRFFIINN